MNAIWANCVNETRQGWMRGQYSTQTPISGSRSGFGRTNAAHSSVDHHHTNCIIRGTMRGGTTQNGRY